MSTELTREFREQLLADPSLILDDRDLMRALVGAREAEIGANVIDIRGRAMEVLETRLDRLEEQHESVIAAAYDNQAGMAVVHRAVTGLLETSDLQEFVASLQSEIAPLLRIESLRLLVESTPSIPGLPAEVDLVEEGMIEKLVTAGRRAPRGDDIILRGAVDITAAHHSHPVQSEALLPLDLGARRPRALLLIGSADAARFVPSHGTDLLRFFGQVFRLVLLMRLKS